MSLTEVEERIAEAAASAWPSSFEALRAAADTNSPPHSGEGP